MDSEIILTTADAIPGQHSRPAKIVDIVCVEFGMHGRDGFETTKHLLRNKARELSGIAVVGINFEFGEFGVRAVGTVITIPR